MYYACLSSFCFVIGCYVAFIIEGESPTGQVTSGASMVGTWLVNISVYICFNGWFLTLIGSWANFSEENDDKFENIV